MGLTLLHVLTSTSKQIWHCILKFEVEKTQAKQVAIDSLTLKFDQLNNSLYLIVGPYLGG